MAEVIRELIGACLVRLGTGDAEVHLLMTDDDRIRELNRRFLGRDGVTDVLSFPDGDELPSGGRLLGEIVISLEAVRRQAEQFGHGELRELSELVLHGVLHLLGYDHSSDHGQMNRLELQLRRELLA